MFKNIILINFLLLTCVYSKAKIKIDILERQNIRKHAEDNIRDFENILTQIISSNNPVEKNSFVKHGLLTVIDSSAKIEDDLDPDKTAPNSSDFVDAKTYLDRFPLLFFPDNPPKSVTFSNIYVGNVHLDEYTYVSIYFECLFSGNHATTNKKFRKVSRLATIKIFSNENKTITKIVNIKFSSLTEMEKIKSESETFDVEYQKYITEKTENKATEKDYKFYVDSADIYFSNKEYQAAKDIYNSALKTKPNDVYCTTKISEIEKIQSSILFDKSFKDNVLAGDQNFAKGYYYTAKLNFEAAQKIYPNDVYVNSMLLKINKKLNPVVKVKKNKVKQKEDGIQSKARNDFHNKVDAGDRNYNDGLIYTAESDYESAREIRPYNLHVNRRLEKIDRQSNAFSKRKIKSFLAFNYTFNETLMEKASKTSELEKGFITNFRVQQLGLSFYHPVGFFVGGIKTWNGNKPEYHYTMANIVDAKNELLSAQIPFTDLTFSKKIERIGSFSTGIYLSFFRPLYFKFGVTQHFGSEWELYTGDLQGVLSNSSKNSGAYAVNYKTINQTDFQTGLAIVIPYFQFETTYNNYGKSLQFSAGLNYPLWDLHIFKRKFSKQNDSNSSDKYASKRYPFKTTHYIALNYKFFDFYPYQSNSLKFNYIVDSSRTLPQLEKFGFSYYGKYGFFISGLFKSNGQIPDVYYSSDYVEKIRSQFLETGTTFTELEHVGKQSHYTKFNLGLSISFFRPLHFKLGAAVANGHKWDLYTGDYNGYLKKFSGTNFFALDYIKINDVKFVGGLSIVFPYCQIEFIYDDFYNQYSASLGLNLPSVRKKILQRY